MPVSLQSSSRRVVVIGGGPAGLMAAEALAARGLGVDLYDAMPSVGRKFLLAGIGGMNLTHSEPLAAFVARYGEREKEISALLKDFDADALRVWASGLGIETFVGSSGRVFPVDMKAAPLLRAWLQRLREAGVVFHRRHRFTGWSAQGDLCFETPDGGVMVAASTVVLALGGASWARLGSDGAWLPWLETRGVELAPLRPANCGFEIGWSEHFSERFSGAPLKSVEGSCMDAQEHPQRRQGECVVTRFGVEGSLVYALSAPLRDAIAAYGEATLWLDLAPQREESSLREALARPRGRDSLSNHWRKRAGIEGVKAGLLREVLAADAVEDAARVAATIKRLPLRLLAARPIDEAISTAGGVRFEALNASMMLNAMPGVFCAGEMLDWEAPTGGYLLTACFASGRRAGQGAAEWAARKSSAVEQPADDATGQAR